MPRTRRFRPAFLSTMILALLAGSLATAAPAAAHDALVSSSPAEGEQLAAPPAQITLEFSNEVLAMGAEVQVNDPTGRNWVEGDLTITAGTVVATVADGMPAGAYEVLWRVVSADGHPISAAIPFSVLQGTPTPTATPTPTVTAAPSPTAAPVSVDDGSDASASSPAPWLIIVISATVIALLVAGLLTLLARRRRR